jgi:hypothetical protein
MDEVLKFSNPKSFQDVHYITVEKQSKFWKFVLLPRFSLIRRLFGNNISAMDLNLIMLVRKESGVVMAILKALSQHMSADYRRKHKSSVRIASTYTATIRNLHLPVQDQIMPGRTSSSLSGYYL